MCSSTQYVHFGWVPVLICQRNCPLGKTEVWAGTLSHESMNNVEAFAVCSVSLVSSLGRPVPTKMDEFSENVKYVRKSAMKLFRLEMTPPSLQSF